MAYAESKDPLPRATARRESPAVKRRMLATAAPTSAPAFAAWLRERGLS